jgi:mannose-1-phosphate guanylyltransferase
MRFAFIMAGGSGERFWPLSRTATPKHLLRLFGGRTMLEHTVHRVAAVVPKEHIYILTNTAQHAAIAEDLPFLPAANIIAEPVKRDTAPACALAVAIAIARSRSEDAICGMFPADAMIHDEAAFARQLELAYTEAQSGEAIVTFGIPPTSPSTAFGYLEIGAADGETCKVVRFTEKPDANTAAAYLAGGRHLWNAGIFLWNARLFLAEADTHAPPLASFIRDFPRTDHEGYVSENFPLLPRISVDYAILEHARSVRALPATFDWDDVGAWTALPRHFPQDADANTFVGTVSSLDSTRCIAVSSGRHIALAGVHDLIVVETPDAILVAHSQHAQDLKALVSQLPGGLT